jgi:hypothetical protein
MKRVVELGAFAAFSIPAELLSRVELTHSTNPIAAKVLGESGAVIPVILTRLPDGRIEVDDPCNVETVCEHAAMVFSAVKAKKVAPKLEFQGEQSDAAEPEAPAPVAPKAKAAAPKVATPPNPVIETNGFRKASKAATKLRLAIYGPAGSGKTMSALRIAKGIGGSIAVIDTENGSSEKYADRFDFSVLRLTDKSPEGYANAMHQAAAAGFTTLVIDSISHEWDELKDFVTNVSKNPRYHGNTWSAWSEGTPKQKAFVQEIISFPGHLIATIRAKTEWVTEQNGGKTTPRRVGLTPEQGKGIEFEFDMLMAISPDHVVSVEKDRTGKYQDQTIAKPDEKFGAELRQWLEG